MKQAAASKVIRTRLMTIIAVLGMAGSILLYSEHAIPATILALAALAWYTFWRMPGHVYPNRSLPWPFLAGTIRPVWTFILVALAIIAPFMLYAATRRSLKWHLIGLGVIIGLNYLGRGFYRLRLRFEQIKGWMTIPI